MLMSDSVAVLMPLYSNPYVTVFPPPPCDPDYFLDLKKHLQENAEYRKERKEFYKLHPGWSLFKARDEFAREYSETYHRDIEWFKRSHPDMTAGEAAQAFCLQHRGYLIVYGLEWTERAFKRVII